MRIVVRARVMKDDMSLSSVAANVADVIEKALKDVPFPVEVTDVELERDS